MVDVAELGIRIDSSPATKAAKELDALTVSATRAGDAAQDLAATSGRKLAPGMAAGGQQSRMMAMQLSQVAQQASATGNYVQALAIQLPDMAMGFGAVGTVAGVLAAVTLPMLATAFSGSNEESVKAEEAANRLKEAWGALAQAGVDAQTEIDKLRFGVDEEYQVELLREQMRLRDEYNRKVQELNIYLATTSDSLDRQKISTEQLRQEIEGIASAYNENAAALSAQAERTATLAVMEGVRVQRANEIKAKQAEAAAEMERQSRAVAQAYENYARTRVEGEKLAEAARKAGVSATDLSHIAFGNISTAATEALRLAGNLGIALDTATKLAALGPQGIGGNDPSGGTYSGRGRAPTQSEIIDMRLAGQFGYTTPPDETGGAGGGGGGGADPYGDRLKALIENLRTEREIEDEWYQESLAILTDRRAQEIMGKQAHDAAMIALHEEYQRRIAEIDANAQQQRISDTANLFGALASIAQAGGQKTAKIVAAFQAIEGTVNAYGAAIKALNTPGLSLAGRFAAYASVLAAGLKGVAAIRSAGGIGGGGGRMAAQGMTSQASGPAIEYRVYGLERDAVYSGAFLEKIFDGLMEEGKRRGAPTTSMVFV